MPARLADLYRYKFGDHTCVFYSDDKELLDIVGPYILFGLEQGERCFVAQREDFIPSLRAFLERSGIHVERAIEYGYLEMHSVEDVYFTPGGFSPEEMCHLLKRQVARSAELGFKGLRTAGDLAWVKDADTFNKLLQYECSIGELYAGTILSMCQYPLTTMSPKLLEAVVHHHNIRVRPLPNERDRYGFSVRNGDFIAELVCDRRVVDAPVYYTVQRLGSDAVLSIGSEPTFERALASARQSLTLAASA
jgi:hypothetical protein